VLRYGGSLSISDIASTYVNKVGMSKTGSIIYILPVPNFFSQAGGVGGHVAHSYGIVNGFAKLGYELDIIADETLPIIENDKTRLHIRPIEKASFLRRQVWGLGLIRLVKRIAQKRRPLFCYARYSVGFTLLFAALKRVLVDIPFVLEVNSFGTQYYNWLKFIDLWALNYADIIICVSETVRRKILVKVSQKFDSKIIVLPNGVDVDRFEEIEPDFSFFKQKKNIKLGYAGILKSDYDFDVLLDAYSMVRKQKNDINLHFFGDGPYYKRLKAKVDSIDGVALQGPVPFEKMPSILKCFDILIDPLSDKNAYGCPTKLYEYMAAGIPVVAAETPPVRELLGSNERGLLYPIGDSMMLSRQILRLIDNPELGQKLADKAFNEVESNHSWQNRILTILDELTQRGLIAG